MFLTFSARCPASLRSRFFKVRPAPESRSGESGYAYIMALFLIVVMVASSQVILQNLVTLRRRQRESDAIWRGQQYVRAIGLYYHKTGHYPQSLDDLQKGLPELHFLRYSAYHDPMNTTDGSWRFIYVNGSGAIIGSVRYASLQQMALIDLNGGALPGSQPGAQLGTPAADLASSSNDASAAANSSPQAPQSGDTASQSSQPSSPANPAAPATGAGPGGATSMGAGPNGLNGPNGPNGPNGLTGALGAQAQAANPLLQLKPTGPVDGPVLGAFITGVASKVDQPSIKVYKGGKKYIDWEFIWNPLEEQARAVQNGLSPQGSPLQQPGQFGLPLGPVNGAPGAAPVPGQPAAGPGAASPQAPPEEAPPPVSNPN
jgi:hypothetical protein